jgi:hypothetical protein
VKLLDQQILDSYRRRGHEDCLRSVQRQSTQHLCYGIGYDQFQTVRSSHEENKGRGILAAALLLAYSLECVEGIFSEVHIHDPA